MPPFKRIVSQFIRLPSKFRRPPTPGGVTLPANTTITYSASDQLYQLVPSAYHSTPQPPTAIDPKEVTENEADDDDDDEDVSVDAAVDVDMEKHEDENENEVPSAGLDIPDTFPFELARKTRLERIFRYVYLALSDDDHEIAALRTLECEKFTSIVRLTFEPPSVSDTLRPSDWTHAVNSKKVSQLHLKCPSYARTVGEYYTALMRPQLRVAFEFIATSLPHCYHAWDCEELNSPFTIEQCEKTRLLIVAPNDRSVDVMAIVLCYLSALSGYCASEVLDSVKRLEFVHSHWRNCSVANAAYLPRW